jgi:NAD(P)-dependent dehydrogenase (short-subunit alcohol dehydrogenase family)
MTLSELAGTSAVVTGGNSGLGLATTQMLVRRGTHVVVADIGKSGSPALDMLGDRVHYLPADVRDPEAVSRAVETAVEQAPLVVAVACAGINGMRRVLGRTGPLPMDEFNTCIAVNLSGSAALLVAAAAAMAGPDGSAGRGGVIVCTGSIAAADGPAGALAYAASKAGVEAMSLVAARDLARFGIRVVSIAPGLFGTPMFNGMPEGATRMVEDVPFPSRAGEPAEFAALVEHVIDNEMINGTTIRVDGAYRMH